MSASPAPNFTLKHIVGHPVSLSDFQGRPVLLIFGGRDSVEQARQIGWTIRDSHGVEAVQIVTILDLAEIPRMMHTFARGRVQVGYNDLARETVTRFQEHGRAVPEDLSQIVVMLPDWDGKVTASYGLKGVGQQAIAVLVGADGTILGQATGTDAGAQILPLLG